MLLGSDKGRTTRTPPLTLSVKPEFKENSEVGKCSFKKLPTTVVVLELTKEDALFNALVLRSALLIVGNIKSNIKILNVNFITLFYNKNYIRQ
jgi:hypothetical protein